MKPDTRKREYRDRREYHKKWREANKEYISQYVKERSQHPTFKKNQSDWRKRNPISKRPKSPEFLLAKKKLRRFRKRNNRLIAAIRGRLRVAIKRGKKCDKTLKLLGCSIEHFKEYIARQFVKGMTWNNHGKVWHLDHIIPCSKFDLRKEEDQRQCFHHSNIQPLFVMDNVRKGNRILPHTQMKIAI